MSKRTSQDRPAIPHYFSRRSLLATALAGAGGAALAGCNGTAQSKAALQAVDLTQRVRKELDISSKDNLIDSLTGEEELHAVYGFAVQLLRQCMGAKDDSSRGNVLVSPLSVLHVLAMLQNGAAGETLAQIEAASGLDTNMLNAYLGSYARRLAGADVYGSGIELDALELSLADSIWMKNDGLSVQDEYLDVCANTLGAQAFEAPFDEGTLRDVNAWVDEKTHGMIPQILDQLTAEHRLLLISALAFEGAWDSPFEDADVFDWSFTAQDGSKTDCRMMISQEDGYLENDVFTGFIKPYLNYDFGFVGLLPKEGLTLSQALDSLDGATLSDLMTPKDFSLARAGLPKFTLEYATKLSEQLRAMGMVDAFDPLAADLSPMATDAENLYVGDIAHKTFIDVNETGTRAAAVTSAEIMMGSARPEEPEIHDVILDRPFAYLIIDLVTMTPVFMGAAHTLE